MTWPQQSARVIVLTEQLTLLRGNQVNPVAPVWAPKDPATTTSRGVDFCQLLYGRRLISATANATGGGTTLTNGAVTVVGSVATVQFTGGTAGLDAAVSLVATFSDGTTETALIDLPLRSPAPLATEGPTQ